MIKVKVLPSDLKNLFLLVYSISAELCSYPGIDDEQGSLACCSPWGRKESDMTE